SLELVQELTRRHIDLNAITADGKKRTALHIASREGLGHLPHPLVHGCCWTQLPLIGNWSVVMALLKESVSVELIDHDGCSPLALALLQRQKRLSRKRHHIVFEG